MSIDFSYVVKFQEKVCTGSGGENRCGFLGAYEKRIKDLPAAEKTQQRQQLAQPVLDDLKAWLEKNSTRAPRDSLTYKAIQYTLNQWDLLTGYCQDGKLHISNVLAENAI
ncbi:IS66 family transposase, partial [Thiolapillus sp.]|uniref:IS66 family transposase n=1 Tax=Thiolapillus sp. TaxID=2017437 RepID=UPI003AF61A06